MMTKIGARPADTLRRLTTRAAIKPLAVFVAIALQSGGFALAEAPSAVPTLGLHPAVGDSLKALLDQSRQAPCSAAARTAIEGFLEASERYLAWIDVRQTEVRNDVAESTVRESLLSKYEELRLNLIDTREQLQKRLTELSSFTSIQGKNCAIEVEKRQ